MDEWYVVADEWDMDEWDMRMNVKWKSECLMRYLIISYWPSTRPCCQKKKCSCVNNRCIRSKISGDQGRPWLSRGWIECELWRSQEVGGYQIIIQPRRQEVQISWREDARMRTMSQQRLGPQAPSWAAQENGKERLWLPEELGGGQYVAVLFSLQLPLTHNAFNKVRGIFFYRTVSARLYCVVVMFSHVYVYSCICIMWLCNIISGQRFHFLRN